MRTFEYTTITDTVTDYKRNYNILQVNNKFNTTLFSRDFYILNYTVYSSVTDKFNALPSFTDKAFLRLFYNDLLMAYGVKSGLYTILTLGYERNLANNRTILAPNGKPMDQIGIYYGFGFDISLTPSAGIYLRHRWFDYKDKNFTLDQLKGYESSLELKIFF
jgi:hypothetical protein